MEENKQSETLHPDVEKIMNFEIPPRKIRHDLRPENGEGRLLAELIDANDIRFDERTGKAMMLHGGILSICDGIGIEFLPPDIQKTGEREYQATVGIKLGDGSIFYGTGEASGLNTDNRELSGKFPVNQTHIRAINKAVVRALGLYRVLLTEEEADEFKTPQVQKMQRDYEAQIRNVVEKSQNREARLLKVIAGIMDLVALPPTDEKYPNAYLIEVKELHEDYAYLEELKQGEDKIIAFVANQMLKECSQNELGDEEPESHPDAGKEVNEETGQQTPQEEEKEVGDISEEEAFLKQLKEGQELLQRELEQTEEAPKE